MGCQSTVKLGKTLTFSVNTHNPSTGAAVDATSEPTYRVYEDETTTPILTGTMAKLDDDNTTGFYSEQITCSAANGFEEYKSYTIRITAVVGGVTGSISYSFMVGNSPLLLGKTYTFGITTHDVDNAAVTDADSLPTYRVYEDETATPIITDTMAKLDDDNTTGFYSEEISLTSGNGFEKYKSYTIYISTTVDGVTATTSISFTLNPAVRSTEGSEQLQISPAMILQEYITTVLQTMTEPTDGSTWPLFISHMPDGTNVEVNCGAIYDTSGLSDPRQMNGFISQHFGLQLRIRSRGYEAGWAKIEDIATDLDTINNASITISSEDYEIQNVRRVSAIIALGPEPETTSRFLFTQNLVMTVKRV